MALFSVGTGLLVQRYRALTGVWVNGLRPGPANHWAWALGITVVVAILGGIVLDRWLDWRAAPVVAGVLVLCATVVLGRRYDDALRAQLRAQRPADALGQR